MPFLNTTLNHKEALLMWLTPNLQSITECTTRCSENCIPCARIQLLLLNLSSIKRISLTDKTSTTSPPNISALSQMDLPAGQGTNRTKSTQVQKGTQNANKRVRTGVEQYITPITMPVVACFAASAAVDSPAQM